MNDSEQVKKLIEVDKQKLTIVFNIEGTLATSSSSNDEETLYLLRKSMLIFTAETEYHVLPGVIELMQFLFSKSYINVAFFNSASRQSNAEFVQQLLLRALGQNKYAQVASSIVILSAEDLTATDEAKARTMYECFEISWANNKKDITKALREGCLLNNAILVDNDSTSIYFDQERNFLRSPWGSVRDYGKLKEIGADQIFYEQKFFEFNALFYIAGLLTDCIELFEKGKEITGFLFDIHFSKFDYNLFRWFDLPEDCKIYKQYEINYDCTRNKQYYEKGLVCLKRFKASISFVSSESYISTLQQPVTPQEQQKINYFKFKRVDLKRLDEEAEETCCIM
jgi:hypothetical protein